MSTYTNGNSLRNTVPELSCSGGIASLDDNYVPEAETASSKCSEMRMRILSRVVDRD